MDQEIKLKIEEDLKEFHFKEITAAVINDITKVVKKHSSVKITKVKVYKTGRIVIMTEDGIIKV